LREAQVIMKVTESITARGHENVLSTNKTTFEITREEKLTKRGDCIIAVGASKAAADLNPKFKQTTQNENALVTITLEAGGEVETISAWGNPKLSLIHPTDLVVRKSDYTCGRTLAVRADKAAKDLSRRLVAKLRNPKQRVKIMLTVETAT